MLGEIVMGGSASLLICMFLGPKFIDYLRLKEFGQQIREEGPAGHHGKAGTPTMGGLAIFLAIAVPFLILSEYRAASLAVLATALAMAALGFVDDIIKLRRRRSLGVSGKTKLLVQGVAAIALWIAVKEKVGLSDSLDLRVIDKHVELGLAYPVLIFLVLAGATNGVNLTDGLDGLAAGLRRDRPPHLHGHDVRQRPAGPCAAERVPGRRVRWLPLVQLVPRVGLHGRHRVAGARRSDRRPRGGH